MLRDAGFDTRLELRRQEERNKKRLTSEETKRIAAAIPKNKNLLHSVAVTSYANDSDSECENASVPEGLGGIQ
jgi:hypothetical protein